MSDSLRPHELQHARPPCLSPTLRVYPNSCPLSRWSHPTISSSAVPFSSCPQSFPASGSFQMSQLFASGGQSIGVSASTYSKAILACYFRYLLTSYFCIPIAYDEKDIFFLVLVLEGLVGLHRTIEGTKNTKKWLWYDLIPQVFGIMS